MVIGVSPSVGEFRKQMRLIKEELKASRQLKWML